MLTRPDLLSGEVLTHALGAGWDNSLLRVSLEQLLSVKLDFSIDTTGFSIPEVDLIIHGSDPLDVPAQAPPAYC